MNKDRSKVFAETDCETCRYNYYKYGSYCNLSPTCDECNAQLNGENCACLEVPNKCEEKCKYYEEMKE